MVILFLIMELNHRDGSHLVSEYLGVCTGLNQGDYAMLILMAVTTYLQKNSLMPLGQGIERS